MEIISAENSDGILKVVDGRTVKFDHKRAENDTVYTAPFAGQYVSFRMSDDGYIIDYHDSKPTIDTIQD